MKPKFEPLKVERTSPVTLTCTRHFAAPPTRVWAAHTEPALLRQWMVGPDGWEMSVCEHEARVGSKIRHEWRQAATGASFWLTAEYEVVEPPHRLVHVERMHMPDPTPDNRVETLFADDGTGGTLMTMTMTVADPETMGAMIATGMGDGMEASYARLEGMF